MKPHPLTTTVFLLVLFFTGLAAQEWTLLNPYPTFHNLRGISSPSSDTVYLVGDHGTLLRSTDAGLTWENVPLPVQPSQLGSVNFISNNKGFIVSGNAVFRTQDAGATWDSRGFAIFSSFGGSYFFNDTLGFLIGENSLIARTLNGGDTWNLISHTWQGEINFRTMQFATQDTGYIAGHHGFLPSGPIFRRTDDCGLSWTDVSIPSEITYIRAIAVLSVDEIWIGAGNVFPGWKVRAYHTTDGGQTWASHDVGISNNSGEGIASIKFFNQLEGRMLNKHHIYSTSDGGLTWEDQYLWHVDVPTFSLRSFAWIDQETGYLAGHGPALLKTTDGGQTFENLISGPACSLWSIYFNDSINGFAGGRNMWGAKLYYTNNAGGTWLQANLDTVPYGSGIRNFAFSTPSVGWAAPGGNKIYKTTDGGLNWILTAVSDQYYGMNYINAPDTNHIYIGCQDTRIFRSADQGHSWVEMGQAIQQHVVEGGMVFTDSLTGFIALKNSATSEGSLYITTNGGQSWQPLDYGSTQRIVCISFVNNQTGVISLNNKKILVTHDGGENWISSLYTPPYNLSYLRMVNTSTIVASIIGNHVAVSYDGGLSFEEIYEGSTGWPMTHNTYFINENLGWGCGSQGMIMRYTALQTGISDPVEFSLPESNAIFYPNPANNIIFFADSGIDRVVITSLEGKVVLSIRQFTRNDLDISRLASGVYIVTVFKGETATHQKLLKY